MYLGLFLCEICTIIRENALKMHYSLILGSSAAKCAKSEILLLFCLHFAQYAHKCAYFADIWRKDALPEALFGENNKNWTIWDFGEIKLCAEQALLHSAMQLGLLRPLPQKQALRAWLMAELGAFAAVVAVAVSNSVRSGTAVAAVVLGRATVIGRASKVQNKQQPAEQAFAEQAAELLGHVCMSLVTCAPPAQSKVAEQAIEQSKLFWRDKTFGLLKENLRLSGYFAVKMRVLPKKAEFAELAREFGGVWALSSAGRLYLVSSAANRCAFWPTGRGGASLCPSACASRPAGSCAQRVVPSSLVSSTLVQSALAPHWVMNWARVKVQARLRPAEGWFWPPTAEFGRSR